MIYGEGQEATTEAAGMEAAATTEAAATEGGGP